MWNSLSEDDKKTIKSIYNHFLPEFPNVDKEILYDRIFCGYCWGEGGSRIMSIEDWTDVFNYTKKGDLFFTCFKDWDEYFKYDGDWHKKLQ